MRETARSSAGKRPRYMAAFLVGTALSTFSAMPAAGGGDQAPQAGRAVQDMSRYCTVCWRNARLQPDHWSDCTQEVLTRVLERVSPDRWDRVLSQETAERREFLRAIDAVKKRSQRAHRPGSLESETPDRREARSESIEEIRHTILQAAEKHLSPRQAQVVRLSLDGWSVSEIAVELQVPASRVSDEKYKAIQKLRGAMA